MKKTEWKKRYGVLQDRNRDLYRKLLEADQRADKYWIERTEARAEIDVIKDTVNEAWDRVGGL